MGQPDWARETMDVLTTGEREMVKVLFADARAPELLRAGADTFAERNAIYGDTYLNIGDGLASMLPKGVHLNTPAEFNRFVNFIQCVGKLYRYAAQMDTGGHVDSAHDLMVYAAMLEETTTS